ARRVAAPGDLRVRGGHYERLSRPVRLARRGDRRLLRGGSLYVDRGEPHLLCPGAERCLYIHGRRLRVLAVRLAPSAALARARREPVRPRGERQSHDLSLEVRGLRQTAVIESGRSVQGLRPGRERLRSW